MMAEMPFKSLISGQGSWYTIIELELIGWTVRWTFRWTHISIDKKRNVRIRWTFRWTFL